ncbi:MAG TPA: phosphatidylserine/phosphatidylglycerophosphate/cardiolipin synthase family protein [Kofleriaceae bacterium]|nr:phosphatidylserine/phosphatidylglycerophosphate/cardiolipin synthase family protein [Kofleriaceae bacterium]
MRRSHVVFVIAVIAALAMPADGLAAGHGQRRPARPAQLRVRPARLVRPARAVVRPRRALRPAAPRPRGRLLASPASAASARLDLIRTARGEINTSTYIFGNDRVGRIMLAELRARARDGLVVRLLVDGFGSGLSRAALAHLLDEGIEVAIYNPLTARALLRPLDLGYRLHDKLLITDAAQMILGGRNVEEGYFGLSKPDYHHFDDVDAHVAGASAAEANAYYMDLWNGPTVKRLRREDLRVSPRKVARYAAEVDRAARIAGRASFADFQRSWRAEPSAELRDVEFVHEDPRTLRNPGRRVQRRLIRFIDEAASEVEIHTPYLVPDPELLGAIARARERGVAVRLVTNSRATARAHEHLTQWAYESQVAELARAGAEVWEVKGPRGMHAKTIVVDRRRVYVGSTNLDPRSRDLQKEVGVVADAPGLAVRLLRHGLTLRDGGLLAARGGQVTPAKKAQCGRACRTFARWVFRPLSRAVGLWQQL